jgi:hypothetical protein
MITWPPQLICLDSLMRLPLRLKLMMTMILLESVTKPLQNIFPDHQRQLPLPEHQRIPELFQKTVTLQILF